MKIVVVGGSGLIGTKLVNRLREGGHDAVAASPSSGIDTLTGAGLPEALKGAQVVVDVTNSPSFEDAAVLEFFQTSARKLLSAEAAAGVRHNVVLSVVGADRLPDSGYMRAQVAQETLIKAGAVPYTIARATQFFAFIGRIADGSTDGDTVRLSPALMQPVAADDVAAALAEIAVGPPANGIVELAGPEALPLDQLVRPVLSAKRDPRNVSTDVHARYFGTELNDRSLTPGDASAHRPDPLRRLAQPLIGRRRPPVRTLLALLCLIPGTLMAQPPEVTSLMSKDLADFPGKEGLMITVEYPPGGSDPVHRHNAHGFIYVLEGSVVMQVKGGKETTLTPGQTFYEGPDDVHVVGRNASTTKPAKFLVLLIKDKGAPVLVPVE